MEKYSYHLTQKAVHMASRFISQEKHLNLRSGEQWNRVSKKVTESQEENE